MRAHLGFALLALVACRHPASEAGEGDLPPAPVACVAARAGAVADEVTVRGLVTVPPGRGAVVAALIAGRVASVEVHEGDHVSRGQLVAVIDDFPLAAAVTQAQADVAGGEGAEVQAKAALARSRRLFEEGIAARREVEDAEARVAAAAADLAAARSRLDLAGAQRQRARVTAPLAGTVIHVLRQVGELSDGTPATPLLEIADTARLELVADVPARDLVRLAPGVAATVVLDALPGRSLPAHVAAVAPAVDPRTALGTVRVALDGPDPLAEGVHLGLAGVAVIAVAQVAAILVPAAALRRSLAGGDEVVRCVGAGAEVHAEARAVTVGERRGEEIVVRAGLAAGEAVVVTHALGLEEGRRLAVAVDAGPVPGPATEPAR